MSTTLRSVALAAITLLVGSAVLAPMATAQATFTVGTIAPPEPIKPDIGQAQIKVPWTYTITNPAGPLTGAASNSVILTWEPPSCDNSAVLITGSLSHIITVFNNAAAPQNEHTGIAEFNVAVGSNAPGEQQIRCLITGSVSALQEQSVPATDPKSGQVNIQAEYLGLLSINVPGTIKQAGPQKQIRYDLEISNLGNSRSNILFGLVGGDEGSGEWNPVLPSQITLESSAQGGQLTAQTVGIVISTPYKNGWNNKDRSFQFEITPVSTKDPEDKGQTITVNVLARVRGVYVPSLEPMVLVGAIIGTALVARLTRQD